jgi:hypothetical protein
LRDVLVSLLEQTEPIVQTDVALFQDVSEDKTLSKECVEVFKSVFPQGHVFVADQNLGVALNFERAEHWAFETCGAEVAFFFEDDLVLAPTYMRALNQMAKFALTDDRIAYVGAYGDHNLSLAQQHKMAHKTMALGHKWGFGLTKRQWLAQKPIVDGYLDIVRHRPYRERDHDAVKRYFAGLGYGSPGTSQDAAKDVACYVLGKAKLNTIACFAKYVGKEGLHFTEALYEQIGYHRTVVYDGVPNIVRPSKSFVNDLIERARETGRKALEEMGVPKDNPAAAAGSQAAPPKVVKTSEVSVKSEPDMSKGEDTAFGLTAGEVEVVKKYLKPDSRYLEFGSGGTTLLAHSIGVKAISTVDCDKARLEKAKSMIGADPHAILSYADIGPTKDWGVPSDQATAFRWPSYYLDIWNKLDLLPNVVLLGGRFRVASALQTIARCGTDSVILFHQFWPRDYYYAVLKYCRIVDRVDSLAVLKPLDLIDGKSMAMDAANYALDWR